MKKITLLIYLLSIIGYSQTTTPDANFEQALIDLGLDTTIDGQVPTANINGVTSLNVSGKNISDLTGIADFTALTDLDCGSNQLISLDLSNNIALTNLSCNTNQLSSLDVRNTNNTAIKSFEAFNNPGLTCILVDAASYSVTNWTNIGATSTFVNNETECAAVESPINGTVFIGSLEGSFYYYSTNELLWSEAQTYAEQYGGNLVSINTQEENDFLTNRIVSNIWIGLTDSEEEGVWKWSDGSQYDFLNWRNGEPNNNGVGSSCRPNGEDYAIFMSSGLWNDLPEYYCGDRRPWRFIIEVIGDLQYTQIPDANFEQALIDLGLDTTIDGQVPTANINGVTSLNVSGKNISDLTGIADFTALTDLDCGSNQLISLDLSNNIALTNLSCNTNQLSSFDVRNTNNTAIKSFEAFNNPGLTCILVDAASYSATNWTNIGANSTFVNNETECAAVESPINGTVFIGSLEGSFYYYSTNELLWSEAQTYAEQYGGNLVSINTQEENDFLTNRIVSNIWIGLTDSEEEGVWKWSDGSQYDFLNWRNGEPNNNGVGSSCRPNGEDYAILRSSGLWNDLPEYYCGDRRPWRFIIEVIGDLQYTQIPDAIFEQALIDLGLDTTIDGQVPTANINGVTSLNVSGKNISDLTGIADFTALTDLDCGSNQLISLDLSNNIALTNLSCNTNQLSSLDVRNTNNTAIKSFEAFNNPGLTCILVDAASYSATNWTDIDATSSFVNNETACTALSIAENALALGVSLHPNPTDNTLFISGNETPIAITIYNVLGKEVLSINNTNNIDVNALPSGVYTIRISDGTFETNRKFIKN